MKLAITCLLLLSIAVLCQLAHGGNGVRVFQATTQKSFECFLKNGYTFAAVRAYAKGGNPDKAAPQTVANAQAANMTTIDLYMVPCPRCSEGKKAKSATKQVNELSKYINDNQIIFNRLWVDIEDEFQWLDEADNNRAFFDELIKACVNQGWNTGVYTSSDAWYNIMGEDFKHGSELPLWYWGLYPNASFSDWEDFGGWTSPTMKDYFDEFNDCDKKHSMFAWNPNY